MAVMMRAGSRAFTTVYSPQYLGHRIEPYAALAVC